MRRCKNPKNRRGDHRSSALLFIRAVDRPISHADICLSKITFLLMSASTSANRCNMREGMKHALGEFESGDDEKKKGRKGGQS